MAVVNPARLFRLASRPASSHRAALLTIPRRCITSEEKPLPKKDTPGKGPNQEQLPHVSEEAAATAEIKGEAGPELEHGTPIQEILQRDKDAAKNAPEILKDPKNAGPKGTRPYSTSARKLRQVVVAPIAEVADGAAHKFGLPELPLPPNSHLKHRHPPIVDKVTRLIMRHGKLARAQHNMTRILNHLRTSPPPKINPARPLIPEAPPAFQLPLNPVEYMACAIDSIAPLVRIKPIKGIAGGGQALPVPAPLSVWQRRKKAMTWILENVEKKPTRGSGHGTFAVKVAEEIIAIVEGRSPLWDRRQTLHKLGTTTRANVARAANHRKFTGRR